MNFQSHSKVWIYQSDKEFTKDNCLYLEQQLLNFTKSWTAHNQKLKAGYLIKYNRFIVLIVDEGLTNASGCSIDKSVHLIQKIEQELGVNLFNRMNFAWKDENNNVKVASREDFQNLIDNGMIDKDTVVFNNLVKTLAELEDSWEVAIHKSWHTNLFQLVS